jgi:hypothetical protein
VLNWAFAAAPGHPALRDAAAAIAAGALAEGAAGGGRWAAGGDAREANADVLERTGPGVWTDALLTWYDRAQSRAAQGYGYGGYGGGSEWSARFLPRVAFGTHPRPGSADGVPQAAPGVVIAHAFAGGWKRRAGVEALPWPLRPLLRPAARLAAAAARLAAGPAPHAAAQAAAVAAHVPQQGAPVYPVSAAWAPPFDVLLPPPPPDQGPTHAEAGAGASAAAHLLAWGMPAPRAAPLPAAALLGPLLRAAAGDADADDASAPALVDIGAGVGFYSLAAAVSGARAEAFEAAAPLRAVLERARAGAGVAPRSLRVHNALFGAFSPGFCAAWRRLGGARGAGLRTGRDDPAWAAARLPQLPCAHPKGLTTLDTALEEVLPRHAAGGPSAPQLALRLAVGGWEGWVLDGAARVMARAPPAVVLIELHPRRLAHSGWGDAAALFDRMAGWGYAAAAHAGGACDAAQGRAPDAPQPSGWCVLRREGAARLARDVPHGATEALLFMRAAP